MGVDHDGNVCLKQGPALVLLSGGFDSTAALGWAQLKHREVSALTFMYGQPHLNPEVVAAGRAATARGVPHHTLALADSLLSFRTVRDHDPNAVRNYAFVPGRNLVFLSVALAHAFALWPEAERLTLVIGCCLEDAAAFPDCTEAFVKSASVTLTHAAGKEVWVSAPWARMPKARIIEYWKTQHTDHQMLSLLSRSWSCYRGTACGACTACVLRARAFEEHKLEDMCKVPTMFGGDVTRDNALKKK